MTPKEYLSQALFIDQRIDSLKEEARQLRETAADVCSPGFGEHHNPNHSTEAPFEKSLLRIWEMEKKADDEMEKLLKLKGEIRDAINRLPDTDQRLVLRYRYMDSLTWPEISCYLNVSERTVFRIHGQALKNFQVPEADD